MSCICIFFAVFLRCLWVIWNKIWSIFDYVVHYYFGFIFLLNFPLYLFPNYWHKCKLYTWWGVFSVDFIQQFANSRLFSNTVGYFWKQTASRVVRLPKVFRPTKIDCPTILAISIAIKFKNHGSRIYGEWHGTTKGSPAIVSSRFELLLVFSV